MSLIPSAPGDPARRRNLQIRPAVPLIYERRTAAEIAHSPSAKSASRPIVEHNVKEDNKSCENNVSARKSSESKRIPSHSQTLRHQNGSNEHMTSPIGELWQDNQGSQDGQETERHSTVSGTISGNEGEETKHKDREHVDSISKESNQESLAISLGPVSSIESISEADSTLHPPESHTGPYARFPNPPGNFAQEQTSPVGWIVAPYDLQVQPQFANGWIRSNQISGIGGLAPPTPSASVDDRNAPVDPKLVDHILSSFNDNKYADVRMSITHDKNYFEEFTFFLHRLLIARSETLRSYIGLSTTIELDGVDNKQSIRIHLCDRLITPRSLEYALRTCYGQAASTFFIPKVQDDTSDHPDHYAADMQDSLAFAAAGHFLKLEEVALQALERTRVILNWDNLEFALSFGLESTYHRHESTEATLLQPFSYSSIDGDSFAVDCARYLLDLSLDFLITSFPNTWTFDKTANPLSIVDRLPPQSKNSISQATNPKLSKIQFGERLPERNSHLTDRSSFISSIVLSLPTDQLNLITLARIPSVARQLPQIVEEREKRRLAALNSEVPWEQRSAKDKEWYWVGFHESLAPASVHTEERVVSCLPVSIYRTAGDEEKAKKCKVRMQDEGPVYN